ncbi:37479_t:CDS:2, partial [Gigaspora margarita]
VLGISYLLPSEYAYSKLTTETDKEKPLQKLEAALKDVSNAEPNPSDPEKLQIEKLIINLQKKFEELAEKEASGEKEKSPTFLFCGEQFNEELKNNKPDLLKEKLQKICEQNVFGLSQGLSPISDLGKYHQEMKRGNKTERVEKTIDLHQFTLVATTSTAKPQLSEELRTKLEH